MEICFSGQLDEVSPDTVDFFLRINVIEFVNTKGNFSPLASDPSEYYGDQYLDWEVTQANIVADNCLQQKLSTLQRYRLVEKYSDVLYNMIWDACVNDKDIGE